MSQYGLSVADLTGTTKAQSPKERVPVAAKYRNDGTGETWTGRGRSPKWLESKEKDQFLIKQASKTATEKSPLFIG
jgi:DNA-binding protein H-NS